MAESCLQVHLKIKTSTFGVSVILLVNQRYIFPKFGILL